MPLQPSYSRRLPWLANAGDSAGDQEVPVERTRIQKLRHRNGSLSLIAGLSVVAGVGAAAIIFPDRLAGLWRSQDWMKPSASWSALIDGKTSASPVKPAIAETAKAPPRAAQVEDQVARAAAEPVLMKAVDIYPTTTSSIRVAPERQSERSSLPKAEPQVAEQAVPSVRPAIAAALKAEAEPQRTEQPVPAKPADAAVTAEVPSAPPPLAAAEPSRAIVPEVTETLKKARTLVERGDIAGARLLLERAAASNDARALMALAETYDPAMLARWGARGMKGDPVKARQLYEKAADTGSAEARARMLALR